MFRNLRILQYAFWGIFILLFSLIISTPYLVKGGVSIFEEEVVELLVLSFLTIIGSLLFWGYSNLLRHRERAYQELVQHVGALNLQVEQIREIIQSANYIPSSQTEIRKMFEIMGNIILSIVNVDWIFIRAVDPSSLRTLTEKGILRGGITITLPDISNKALCQNGYLEGNHTFSYKEEGNFMLFIIFPLTELNDSQATIVRTVTTNVGILFAIFRERQGK